MKAARIQDGTVVEVVELPNGVSVSDAFHPDVGFIPCPEGTAPGMLYDNGQFSQAPPPVIDGAALDALKNGLKASVDFEAEQVRLKYITPGGGQALTYIRKVEQARAAIAHPDPQPADFPLLAATIGIDGETIVDVAHAVLAMDAVWDRVGAAIEQARMFAKTAIDAAPDATAAYAARDAVVWPSSAS